MMVMVSMVMVQVAISVLVFAVWVGGVGYVVWVEAMIVMMMVRLSVNAWMK
jgi:hypothetical protein